MLVLQLAVPRALPLPEPGVVRPFALPPVQIAKLSSDPAILTRPIFGGGVSGTAVEKPIDGAVAIGVMSRQGGRTAFVRGADGQVTSLKPGDLFHGWRLVTTGRDTLVFARGSRVVTLPVTAETDATAAKAVGATLPHPIN